MRDKSSGCHPPVCDTLKGKLWVSLNFSHCIKKTLGLTELQPTVGKLWVSLNFNQLSAVVEMLQCSSNKQGIICEINRVVAIPPSVTHSKENSGSH